MSFTLLFIFISFKLICFGKYFSTWVRGMPCNSKMACCSSWIQLYWGNQSLCCSICTSELRVFFNCALFCNDRHFLHSFWFMLLCFVYRARACCYFYRYIFYNFFDFPLFLVWIGFSLSAFLLQRLLEPARLVYSYLVFNRYRDWPSSRQGHRQLLSVHP